MLHDSGQLCYSFFLPFSFDERLRDINMSWLVVFEFIQKALSSFGLELDFHKPCDFAVGNRKICGNSSRRGLHGTLIHGTILLSSDVWRFPRYLNHPSDEPEYRRGRGHTEFVTTLEQLGVYVSRSRLIEEILKSIGNHEMVKLPGRLSAAARDLIVVKYSRDEWNLKM
ncbi:MAG: hypothetical protein Kow00107_11110 [Planctomycetota bacterium]